MKDALRKPVAGTPPAPPPEPARTRPRDESVIEAILAGDGQRDAAVARHRRVLGTQAKQQRVDDFSNGYRRAWSDCVQWFATKGWRE